MKNISLGVLSRYNGTERFFKGDEHEDDAKNVFDYGVNLSTGKWCHGGGDVSE